MLVAVISLVLSLFFRLLVIRLPHFIIGVLLIAALSPTLDLSIFDRVLDMKNYTWEKSQTLRIRVAYWKAGFRIAEDNFLFGVGIGNESEIPKALSKRIAVPKQSSVHNEYLNTLIEVGIMGWVIHYSMIVLLLIYALRSAGQFRGGNETEKEYYWFMVATLISMTSVLIYGLQCDVFRFPLKPWWLIAGITCMMHDLANEKKGLIATKH